MKVLLAVCVVLCSSAQVTEYSDTVYIDNGVTEITIAHHLDVLPYAEDFNVVQTIPSTNNPNPIYIDDVDYTNFTINCQDPGPSGVTFSWKVHK